MKLSPLLGKKMLLKRDREIHSYADRVHPVARRVCHFGVFDGHGGKDVAILAASILHEKVLVAGLQQVGRRCLSLRFFFPIILILPARLRWLGGTEEVGNQLLPLYVS